MQTPTIIKQTKNYLLVKIPLPKQESASLAMRKNGKSTVAEKHGWKRIQESQRDIQEGRVVTASSLKEALRRYEKRQWDN